MLEQSIQKRRTRESAKHAEPAKAQTKKIRLVIEAPLDWREANHEFRKAFLKLALRANGDNITHTADSIGIVRRTLQLLCDLYCLRGRSKRKLEGHANGHTSMLEFDRGEFSDT
ncbi:MAG: hypothetical protein H6508_08370 [Calditrichaeota bacterium]|nr:hypothetical protein [Calditrichota bacterium]MCB9367178.1 hypothetical protein [Calditrichota bacterium]